MQSGLNGSTFKYHFGVRRFHIIPQSYGFSQGLWLKNFLQVLLLCNQRYQVPLLIYINQYGQVSCLVIGRKLLGDMKYLMRSVKIAVEGVGVWTGDHLDVKRVN